MGDLHEELKERVVHSRRGGDFYQVFVTRAIFGKDSQNPANANYPVSRTYDAVIPEYGKWITIPNDRVIKYKDAIYNCPIALDTCNQPSANILWLSKKGEVYCYWPIQHWVSNPIRKDGPLMAAPHQKFFSKARLAGLNLL